MPSRPAPTANQGFRRPKAARTASRATLPRLSGMHQLSSDFGSTVICDEVLVFAMFGGQMVHRLGYPVGRNCSRDSPSGE